MFESLVLAFVTGLTTGGLSCLAVQGGLLASSLARQLEQDLLHAPASGAPLKSGRKYKAARPAGLRLNTAQPIALFLLAKLVAYTLLGALLGWLGSFLTFDPITRALMLFAIGVFMVGNGLRLLNVHPIFRYFNLEPPKFITRYIRRTAKDNTATGAGAKSGADLSTPLFLGALTVFIPCGVTQAMMAAALATGSPMQGAALMFAFTLGTSPVFFAVAYLTVQLGARLERFFMRFVGVLVLILGLLSMDNGLNLLGAPSVSGLVSGWFAPPAQTAPAAAGAESSDRLVLTVADNGYFPARLNAPADTTVSLELVTDNTRSCARDFVIPALKYYKLLPQSGVTTVEIPPQAAGTVMRFTCSMGMYTGQIVFGE